MGDLQEDTFVFGDATTYTGQFKRAENGTVVRHGKGVHLGKDGVTYEGNWINNRYAGPGVLSLPDGSSYTGEFSDNQFDGIGTYTWVNGSSFKGKWGKNRPFDDGHYTDEAGIVWVGPFSAIGGTGLRPVLP